MSLVRIVCTFLHVLLFFPRAWHLEHAAVGDFTVPTSLRLSPEVRNDAEASLTLVHGNALGGVSSPQGCSRSVPDVTLSPCSASSSPPAVGHLGGNKKVICPIFTNGQCPRHKYSDSLLFCTARRDPTLIYPQFRAAAKFSGSHTQREASITTLTSY